jgi:dTDP-4-dehydrorhamnose reductase
VRTTLVYGPEPQGKNFVYQLLRRLGAGLPTTVPADQRSTPTYNQDLAAATVELVEGGLIGVWHLAGPAILDRHGFALIACDVFGLDPALVVPVTTAALGQRAPRPLHGGLGIDRSRSGLATPLRGPREGLEAMRAVVEAAAGGEAPTGARRRPAVG